jgi:ElaA protein
MAEGGVQIGSGPSLQWYDFAELSTTLLYEMLRFRQAIFVVEQACAYPDLDGIDQRTHHLMLHVDGALAGYLRLIPFPDANRVAIGRVAVAVDRRQQGLARRLVAEALTRCRGDYRKSAITLSAQTYLTAFYAELGFRPSSPPYDDYGVPHIDMLIDP